MATPDQMPPKITFPCQYPIKVIGNRTDDFQLFVMSIVKQYDPTHNGYSQTRDSGGDKYMSVKFNITATSEDQIKHLFKKLKKSAKVHIVL